MLRICFHETTREFVVLERCRVVLRTTDIVEAVATADPEGTGRVNCDAETERRLMMFTDETMTSCPCNHQHEVNAANWESFVVAAPAKRVRARVADPVSHGHAAWLEHDDAQWRKGIQ